MNRTKLIRPPERRLNEIPIFAEHIRFLYNTVLELEKQLVDIKSVLAQYHHKYSLEDCE